MVPFTLRLPEDLHDALRGAAEGSGRSLQREIEWRLRSSFNVEAKGLWVPPAQADRGVQLLDAGLDEGEPSAGAAGPSRGRGTVAQTTAEPASPSSSPGACTMDVPVGVKCKVCGKVHTPKGKR